MTPTKFIWPPPFIKLQLVVLASTIWSAATFINKKCLYFFPSINRQIHTMSNGVEPVKIQWFPLNVCKIASKGILWSACYWIKFSKMPQCSPRALLYSILIELSLILSVEARTAIVVLLPFETGCASTCKCPRCTELFPIMCSISPGSSLVRQISWPWVAYPVADY